MTTHHERLPLPTVAVMVTLKMRSDPLDIATDPSVQRNIDAA
jgi:hypothetical protein